MKMNRAQLFQSLSMSLFSDDLQVLAIAVPALRANTIMFIPVILYLPTVLGMTSVIYSQAVADLLTTFVTVYLVVRVHRQLSHAV